ncbi:hypothetical protein Scep_003668 [Stephania cephalantha]|uniref:Uncharacterized protein n=1 Tax=Stephania cephalantha TaxID=152367 RepID=A0AAP0KTN0_9MAGN
MNQENLLEKKEVDGEKESMEDCCLTALRRVAALERHRCRSDPFPRRRCLAGVAEPSVLHAAQLPSSWPPSALRSHCRTASCRPPLDLEPRSLSAGWPPPPSESPVPPPTPRRYRWSVAELPSFASPSRSCWDATAARAAVLSPPLAEHCRALPAASASSGAAAEELRCWPLPHRRVPLSLCFSPHLAISLF